MRSTSLLAPALAGALALAGCDRNTPAPAPAASAAAPVAGAVITMDDAHDMMTVKAASIYTIGPSKVLALEVGQHRFRGTDAGAPDAVHVTRKPTGYYRGSFKGPRVELGAATL